MTRKTTKPMALIISILMLITLLPTATLAAPGDVCEINGVGYADFGDALAAVQDGDTVKLLADIDYNKVAPETGWANTGAIHVVGKSVIFDLNGYTLNVVNTSNSIFSHGLYVDNGEVSLIGKGEFNVTGYYAVTAQNNSRVEVNNLISNGSTGRGAQALNGSIITVNGDISSIRYGARADNGCSIIICGNITILSQDTEVSGSCGVAAYYGCDITVNGNITVTGAVDTTNYSEGVRISRNSRVTVNGNIMVSGVGNNNKYGVNAFNEVIDGSLTIVNGDITVNGANSYGVAARDVESLVYVNGEINIPDDGTYIQVGVERKTQNDNESVSTKIGYLEYTDGNRYVWIKTTHPCADGHLFIDDSDGEDYIAPTCTVEGFMPSICDVCGTPGVGYELSALGHDWDNGVVTIEPTARMVGEKLFTCKVCEDTYTVVLAKLRVDGVSANAFVEKLNGNKNNLTITVTELVSKVGCDKLTEVIYKATISINNNAAGTYQVGPYKVYVDTKGNTQIRELRIVDGFAENDDAEAFMIILEEFYTMLNRNVGARYAFEAILNFGPNDPVKFNDANIRRGFEGVLQFGPNDPVTRSQVTTLQDALRIIQNFGPNDPVTAAQAATIKNALELVLNFGPNDPVAP